MYGQFEHYNLIVNGNHPIAGRLLAEEEKEKKDELAKQLIDLALLSQNFAFGRKIKRICETKHFFALNIKTDISFGVRLSFYTFRLFRKSPTTKQLPPTKIKSSGAAASFAFR